MEWLERKVKWIEAIDGEPPIGRCVLATNAAGRVGEAFRGRNRKWRWSHGDVAPDITHWMELPTSPAQFELDRVGRIAQSYSRSSRLRGENSLEFER